MSMREREGLIARIRQIRRVATTTKKPAVPSTTTLEQDELNALEARITHLERLVQGLQDSAHREALRHNRRIAELEARIQPAELGKALSQDARERGL
jgi:hypothetical protein